MKKFAAVSLLLVLMFATLGMFTTGSASANDASHAPLRAAGTATPTLAPNRPPPSGVLPIGGGDVDQSGALLAIGVGCLLAIGGLALRTHSLRRPHA